MKRFKCFSVPMVMAGILFLSGCASLGQTSSSTLVSTLGSDFQADKIPAGKAVVYIYRSSPSGGLAGGFAADVNIPFNVKANGKVITRLVQGGYYAYITEPGQIEFTAQESEYSGSLAAKLPFSITVDAKVDQTYYFKGAHSHGFIPKLSLVSVSSEVGIKEIVNCKLIKTTLDSTSALAIVTQQAADTANAYGEKIFVGKIEYTSRLSLHIPPGRTLRISSDNGDKLTVFVSKDIAIRDMKGYPIRIGEKAEVKYSSVTSGENEVISFRYVPLDYVQQPIAPVIPAKTTSSTQASAQGSSFQLGETIPSGKAVVYIYRPRTRLGKIPFNVKANDRVLATLAPSGYYAYIIEPGQIEFTAFDTGSSSSVTVDAKAGQVYYLKGANGKWGGSVHLESVSSEAGANEIISCKLVTTQ